MSNISPPPFVWFYLKTLPTSDEFIIPRALKISVRVAMLERQGPKTILSADENKGKRERKRARTGGGRLI